MRYNLTIDDDQVMVDPPIPDDDEPVDSLIRVTDNDTEDGPEVLPITNASHVLAALREALPIYEGIQDGDEFCLDDQPLASVIDGVIVPFVQLVEA